MTFDKIGDSPRRREDQRFLTGHAEYLDDRTLPGLAHAVVLRSTHAHALVSAINVDAARAAPGVLAVLTTVDVQRDGLQPLRPTAEANVKTAEPFAFMPQPLLATGKVRYVGEPVAVIVAETREQALDASDLIGVDYIPLPCVTTADAARAADAPQIAAAVPGNLCFDWQTGDTAAVEAAFARATHTVSISVDNHRIITNPMEPRGIIATHDPATDHYTAHVSSQNVHAIRDFAARSLGVPPSTVRFIAPDVGGNFGAKNFIYADYVLMLWAAKVTGRPVKWIATRSEVFLTDHQARDQQAQASLALDAEGRFLALRVDSIANAGAYMVSTGGVQTFQYPHLPSTVYRMPAIALRIAGVLTNTTPVGVTRGPGFAEANNIMERLIDVAARQSGFDRAQLRRINLVPSADMPMTNVFGETVDSGAFPETLDRALAEADMAGFAARRQASERKGCLRGLGFAYHIKGTGGSPHENAEIRFEADGTVSLFVGTHATGQGHETTFPQIVADRLGLPNAIIKHRQGDTDLLAIGGGSGSSRSTYMAGTAIWRASDTIIAKGQRIAADMLETAEADLRFAEGRFVVAGTDRSVGLLAVAVKARALQTPLDTYHRWTRDWMTFPNGAHVVEVEIERDTGRLTIERYTAVDDYGVIVNPMIVAGQAHGAIAQGIGQALMERAAYDADSGQPITGSFMDYALPRADDLPSITLSFNGSPCTTNPLGVKGVGEAGAIAAFPAIANAIYDALEPFGAGHLEGPATPERIWRAMQAKDWGG
jgi:aerobic carbon-monoxide dehydrogenase large subunit